MQLYRAAMFFCMLTLLKLVLCSYPDLTRSKDPLKPPQSFPYNGRSLFHKKDKRCPSRSPCACLSLPVKCKKLHLLYRLPFGWYINRVSLNNPWVCWTTIDRYIDLLSTNASNDISVDTTCSTHDPRKLRRRRQREGDEIRDFMH